MNLPDDKKVIDEQLVNKLIYYIRSSCKKSSKVVVEINSAITSLAAGVLFQKALGEKTILIVLDFGSPKTNALTRVCKTLNLNPFILNRAAAYQKELAAYRLRGPEALKNFYLRFKNYHLLIQSDQMKADLVNTIDKSDRLLNPPPEGFYGHLVPFYSLFKSEVFDLAKFLGLQEIVPEEYDYWTKMDQVLILLQKEESLENIARQFNLDPNRLKKLKKRIDKQKLETSISQFII
ncbi:MAG: hypothetical protein UT54_C0002G0019 [Candidatus Daviesbacteria bacterium GW2011_GWB1_39_5]|nr:MAG: hypothetical protein UT54_C0002G0019 [Candidatus Daviesbacteria bacterium GW2011_GWB1_39_5]